MEFGYKNQLFEEEEGYWFSNRGNREFLIGIFDGHEKGVVSSSLEKYFHKVFYKKLDESVKENPLEDSNMQKIFYESYRDMDKLLMNLDDFKEDFYSGSSSTTIFISNGSVYTAGIGNSSAVLYRVENKHENFPKPTKLTYSHDKTSLTEKEDVGHFLNGVFSDLCITRSFGDYIVKGVCSSIPSYSKFEICQNDRFLVVASQGIWNVMTQEEVGMFISLSDTPQKAADKIVAFAQEKWEKKDDTCDMSISIVNFCEWNRKNLEEITPLPKVVDLKNIFTDNKEEIKRDSDQKLKFIFSRMNFTTDWLFEMIIVLYQLEQWRKCIEFGNAYYQKKRVRFQEEKTGKAIVYGEKLFYGLDKNIMEKREFEKRLAEKSSNFFLIMARCHQKLGKEESSVNFFTLSRKELSKLDGSDEDVVYFKGYIEKLMDKESKKKKGRYAGGKRKREDDDDYERDAKRKKTY